MGLTGVLDQQVLPSRRVAFEGEAGVGDWGEVVSSCVCVHANVVLRMYPRERGQEGQGYYHAKRDCV